MAYSEREQGQQPTMHPVGEFLQNQEQIKITIDTLQGSGDRYWNNRPTDEIFAKKLIQVGYEHIKSVLKEYPDPELPFPQYIIPQQRSDVEQSIAAITFGASYIVLRNFFATTTPNKNGEIIFDNTYLFAVFDKVTNGLPLTHTDAFSQFNPATERLQKMNEQTWRMLSHTAHDYGIFFLFHFSQGGKQPDAIRKLMHGLGVTEQVRKLAIQFGEILPKIESKSDAIARLEDFQYIKHLPQRRTSAQMQRDAKLIELLGADYEKYFEPTPKVQPPQLENPSAQDKPKRWDDKDWFDRLFKE